ncbi:hypothetical protein AB0O47_39730 [Streptomyces noursei]|uniref:hypothetical protein n=1 Tax=Streptomyces noursei TaxID=1971 RepID=UPI00344CE348
MTNPSISKNDLLNIGIDWRELDDDMEKIAVSFANIGAIADGVDSPYSAVIDLRTIDGANLTNYEATPFMHYANACDFILYPTAKEAHDAFTEDVVRSLEDCVNPLTHDTYEIHHHLQDTDDRVTVVQVESTNDGHPRDLYYTVWRHNGRPGFDDHHRATDALNSALIEAETIHQRVGDAATDMIREIKIALWQWAWDQNDRDSEPRHHEIEVALLTPDEFDVKKAWLIEMNGWWTNLDDGSDCAGAFWDYTPGAAYRRLLDRIDLYSRYATGGYHWNSPTRAKIIAVIETGIDDNPYHLVWALGDQEYGHETYPHTPQGLDTANARAVTILALYATANPSHADNIEDPVPMIEDAALQRRVLKDAVAAQERRLGAAIRAGETTGRIGRGTGHLNWNSLAISLRIDNKKLAAVRRNEEWTT